MIKILIVEDNKYKSQKIKSVLVDDLMIDPILIDCVADIKAAKKLLVDTTYDLLILDLVLPLEIGDDPAPEKGIGFLKDLEMNPSLHSPVHIIGLTEFGDLKSKFEGEFEQYLWYLVNYNPIEVNWQHKLKNLVYHLISTKNRLVTLVSGKQCFDIAVITALSSPEFDKILEWPVKWEKYIVENDPSVYYHTLIASNGKTVTVIAACVEQMGMTATAVLTTKMVHNFRPKVIIMGGICAGLKERNLNYGDILIGEQSWDYGSGKIRDVQNDLSELKETIFEPDPRPIQLSASLKGKINSFLRRKDIIAKIQTDCKYNKPKNVLAAHMGPIASGSYVISSQNILDEIKNRQRKLLGVEMEGYGLYYTCEHNQDQFVKGILIKSVSDFGDSTKNDAFQDYSSFTSAQFIYHFIVEELM